MPGKVKQILLFALLILHTMLGAQTLQQSLPNVRWHTNQQMGDSVVILSKDPSSGGTRQWQLNSTQRCLLKYTGSKTDSSFEYTFDKKYVSFHFKLKDSARLYRYELYQNKPQSITLRLNYSFVYNYKKGNDSIIMPELTLYRGKQIKTILRGEDITVFSQIRARRNDSIDMAVWGQFVGFVKDTILIDTDQFVKHNFYKKHNDSLHYYAPLLMDTIIHMKIPLKYVTGIYKEREPFGMYMTRTTIAGMSVGLGFMMASMFSGTDNNSGHTYATIAAAGFLTVPVSFGLGVGFSKIKFKIKGGQQPEQLWKIERHMPHPKVKIYKKGKRII